MVHLAIEIQSNIIRRKKLHREQIKAPINQPQNIKFKDIISWNISEISTKTIPISTRIVLSLAESQWKQTIKIFEWRESHHCITQIVASDQEGKKSIA